MAWDARVGNAGEIFDSIMAMVRRFAPDDEKTELDTKLAELDGTLGLSLRADLLAHLGPEFAFVLDLPPVDQAMGAAMSRNPDAAASTLEGIGVWCSVTEPQKVDHALRVLLERAEARVTDVSGAVRVSFETVDAADAQGASTGPTSPKPELFYALSDDLLAFGFSAERATAMLQPCPVGDRLSDGTDYKAVMQHLDPHPQSVMYVNLPKIQRMIEASSMVRGMLGSQPDAEPFLELVLDPELAPMGLGATSIPVENGTRQTSVGPSWLAGGKYMGAIVASIAVPNLINAVNRGRQKRTMADLRTLGTALETYAVENGSYPATDGWVDSTTLSDELAPRYIVQVPATDAWESPIRYWSDGEHYRLLSMGKDGVQDQEWTGEIETTETSDFDSDLVFADGTFVVYPAGVQW